MGPSAGHGWACHHVDAAPEPTSDLLYCCFWLLPPPTATHILAALLWRGRCTGSGGASEEEGLGGFWPEGCLSWMVATTAGASVLLGAPLGGKLQNEHWLSVPVGRQFGLKWEWLGLGWWGTSCLVPVCTGKSSQIYLALLTSLPCPLCSFFLKSCPGSSGRGFPWEGTPFSVLGSPDCSPWGR